MRTGLRTYPREGSGSVLHPAHPCQAGAVCTAEEAAVRLHAVADHLYATVLAGGSEGVDRALEAVEGVRVATSHSHLEALIVLISTDLALGHLHHPFRGRSDCAFLR